MVRPPHDLKDGVFTWPIIIDTMSYGIAMGATSLATFVIVIYGKGTGDLGNDCNHGNANECDLVFRARSATFAAFIFQILIYALELKSLDRSMFSITPGRPFWVDMWMNKVLLFSVLGVTVSTLLPIYVPGFNDKAMYQGPIGWEWGLVFGMTVLFVVYAEVWKIARKPLYKRAGWAKELASKPTGGE
jgi:Na+-exporting ATPase